jgi:hypothetical protein
MEGQNPTTGSSDSHLGKQDRRRDMRLMTHGIKSHPPSAPLFVQGDRNNHGPGGKKKGNFPGKLFFIFNVQERDFYNVRDRISFVADNKAERDHAVRST